MVTQEQFDFFKKVYQKEEDRFKELIGRGKIFISIITIYIGIFTLKVTDLGILEKDNLISKLLFLSSGFSFIISLVFSVLSIGIFNYEGIFDFEEEVRELIKNPRDNSKFYRNRLVDLTVSYERNSIQNDKRARYLWLASVFIFLGIFSHLIMFYIHVF